MLTPTLAHQVLTVVAKLKRGMKAGEVVFPSQKREPARYNEEAKPISLPILLHQEQVNRQR